MTIKDSRGFWQVLSAVELADSPKIAKMLKPFHEPVQDCYECGVEVPTLSCKREKGLDITVTALFLKRVLNDLRAIWNLLMLGYTSQAGSVAAAAFENAFIIICVADNEDRAKKLLSSKSSRSPWSVAELCKMYTSQLEREGNELKKRSADLKGAAFSEILYAQYQWLCNLKHPTIPSVLHDAFSVSLIGDEYTIMAAPDTRMEDLPSKTFVLTVTVLHITEAIESFALARKLDDKDSNVIAWKKRLGSILTNLDKASKPIMKKTYLPFDHKGRIRRQPNAKR